MDKETIRALIKDYGKDMVEKGYSEVVCPICKKIIKRIDEGSTFVLTCSTKDCFYAEFRGL